MAKKNEKNIKDKTSFTKKFKAELKKVIWPTPKQLLNNDVEENTEQTNSVENNIEE